MISFFATLVALAATPQPMFEVSPAHRLLEGVASDGRVVWVSSVIDRTVLECRATCRTLAKLPPGLYPLGMAWDSSRQRLWIAADCPPFPNFAKCDRGALVALDRRGRLTDRLVPLGANFHSGDVSADRGNVFVGDAFTGAIYWLKPGQRRLTTLVPPGIGKSAQGSALDRSGSTLIAADYGQGVAAIELATGKRTVLTQTDGTTLRGIDGLVRCGNGYVGVFNGAEPNRLLSITVSGARIDVDTIYSGPEARAPTQVAVARGGLVVAADASWEKALKSDQPPHGRYPIRALPFPGCTR